MTVKYIKIKFILYNQIIPIILVIILLIIYKVFISCRKAKILKIPGNKLRIKG